MTPALAQDRRLEAFDTTRNMGSADVPREYLFAADSLWNTPITDKTPWQDPEVPEANSANWRDTLCWQMAFDPVTNRPSPTDLNDQTGVSTGQINPGNKAWQSANIPVYVVPAGYPRRPWTLASYNMGTVGGPALNVQLQRGVPCPVDAVVSGLNTDRWLNIYQPSTDTLWELYACDKSTPGGPYDIAGWGGIIYGVSKHNGTYHDIFNAAGVQTEGRRWSGNACSISQLVGLTEMEEIRDGYIGHTMAMSLGHVGSWVLPATRGDPDRVGAGYAPEGMRITFEDGADTSRIPSEYMPVFNAINTFGIIPRDKTGHGVNIHLRDKTCGNGNGLWLDVLPLYTTSPGTATKTYVNSLPWGQAIIVAPPETA